MPSPRLLQIIQDYPGLTITQLSQRIGFGHANLRLKLNDLLWAGMITEQDATYHPATPAYKHPIRHGQLLADGAIHWQNNNSHGASC